MQTMNISLPEPLKDFVENQVNSGRYSSASEYVRELIRDDEKRRAQEQLEHLLLEGLQSGDTKTMDKQDWAQIKQAVQERLRTKKPG